MIPICLMDVIVLLSLYNIWFNYSDYKQTGKQQYTNEQAT